MLITLSRRTAICESVAEVQLTNKVSLGALSHYLIFFQFYTYNYVNGWNSDYLKLNKMLLMFQGKHNVRVLWTDDQFSVGGKQ